MKNSKYKKKSMSLLLVLLILGISLGYAILTQDLTIVGTSGIKNARWSVYFDNLVVSNGSVSIGETDQAAVIDNSTKTDISYTVTLNKPGDFYEFTVDVVNDGTIDAMIDSINNKVNNNPISNLPSYLDYSITYSDGVGINTKQLLKAGSTENIKVRIEFKKDIAASQLPSSGKTLNFDYGLTYVQADYSAVEKPSPYIFAINSNSVSLNEKDNYRFINTLNTTYYAYNQDELIENTKTVVFLRYKNINGEPHTSDIGFNYNGQINYLLGDHTMESYHQNKEMLDSLFGSSNCIENFHEESSHAIMYYECKKNNEYDVVTYAPVSLYSFYVYNNGLFSNIYVKLTREGPKDEIYEDVCYSSWCEIQYVGEELEYEYEEEG